MPRRKKKQIRDRQFNISLTAHELELLQRRAAASGMRPVDYGRQRLFAEWRITEASVGAAPHLDPLFQVQLSRLGNNLNQIARRMNSFDAPGPPSLEPLLQEIRVLINRGHSGDR